MKKVVVIGGGFAGSLIAKALEKDYDVTLIDDKDYFEYTPSILRTIVEPETMRRIQVLHSGYLHRAHIHRDSVKTITHDAVRCGRKDVPFDYLVIASGSTYSVPIKHNVIRSTRASELRRHATRVADAKSILIIGGGFVGVELAAEIAEKNNGKQITIIDPNTRVMSRGNPKASAYAQRWLERHGVKLLFGERVKKSTKTGVVTDKGTKLHADVIFLCTGIAPNSAFIKGALKACLDERGFVKVDETMRACGVSNVFAAGDVTAVREEKTAHNAEHHATIVVENIRRLDAGKPLNTYHNVPRTMVVSLGKWCGILIHKDVVFGGIIPGLMKTMIERWYMRKYR